MRGGKTGRTRSRWLVAIAVVSVALAALYLIGVNLILSTGLLRSLINANPDSIYVDYTSAFSFLPGRIHVKDLRISGRDDSVEWVLSIDDISFTVGLVPLFSRRFTADAVDASGFRLRLRLRRAQQDLTPEVLAALPSIPGISGPPLKKGEPEPPGPPQPKKGVWTIELENVEVSNLRELWIDTVRFEGDANVLHGRWLFRPEQLLEVGPASVEIHGGTVAHGRHTIVEELQGTLAATVHPSDLLTVKGHELLGHASAEAHVAGVLTGIDIFDATPLRSRDLLAFSGGSGAFDADIVLQKGVLAPGSRAEMDSDEVRVVHPDVSVHGNAHAALEISSLEGLSVATVRGVVRNVVADMPAHHDGEIRVPSAEITIRSADVDLAHDPFWSSDIHVAGVADTPSIAWISDVLPQRAGVRLERGAMRVEVAAGLTLPQRVFTGGANLRLSGARARVADLALATDVEASARLERLGLRDGRLALAPLQVRALHTEVSVSGGAPALRSEAFSLVSQEVLFEPREGARGSVELDAPDVVLVDATVANSVLSASSEVRVLSGTGHARAHLDADLGSRTARGRLEAKLEGLGVAHHSLRVFGDAQVVVEMRRAGSEIDLSKSVLTIPHADMFNAPAPSPGWWGTITLQDGKLRLEGPTPGFAGRFTAQCRDARPISSVFVRDANVPDFIARVFTMEGLFIEAALELEPGVVDLHNLLATGGGISFQGLFQQRGPHERAALLVEDGMIKAGIGVIDGQSSVVLDDAVKWFHGQVTATSARH